MYKKIIVLIITLSFIITNIPYLDIIYAEQVDNNDYVYGEVESIEGKDTDFVDTSQEGSEDFEESYDDSYKKSGDFYYVIKSENNNNVAEIVGYTGNSENVVVPNEIDGMKVTRIEEYTFYGFSNIVNVDIQNGIEEIGSNAFCKCENLNSINIPKSVVAIDMFKASAALFYECQSMENINVDSQNTKFKSINGVLFSKDGKTLIKYPQNRGNYTIPDQVESIEEGAFLDGARITNINISNKITYIGRYAFLNCNNLKSIEIPSSIEKIQMGTFAGCTNLKSIKLCEGIKYIDQSAFNGCESLVSIHIPKSVISIGTWAFSDCYNLKSAIIENGNTEMVFDEDVGAEQFEGCSDLTIYSIEGSKVQEYAKSKGIPFKAIEYKSNLFEYKVDNGAVVITECTSNNSNITIPSTVNGVEVKSIGKDAFLNNTSVEEITISEGIETIGANAFEGCINLETLNISSTVKNIPYKYYEDEDEPTYAFLGCDNLENINVSSENDKFSDVQGVLCDKKNNKILYCPNGKQGSFTVPNYIEDIYGDAFKSCGKIEEVKISSDLEVGTITFEDCSSLNNVKLPTLTNKSISTKCFENCINLESIDIPDNISIIGNNAFKGCKSLKEINMADNIRYIHDKAFSGCESLTKINLPNSLISVDSYCFEDCKKISEIIIPESVIAIESYAFKGCTNLKKVTIPNTVEYIGENVFTIYISDINDEGEEIGYYEVLDGLTICGMAGSYAENYADNNNINFEATQLKPAESALKIQEFTYPLEINKGDKFEVGGIIISNYRLESVDIQVLDTFGNVVLSDSLNPDGNYVFSPSDVGGADIAFETLPAGNYVYKIIAKDKSGVQKTLVNKSFIVKGDTSLVVTFDLNNGLDYVKREVTKGQKIDYTPQIPVKNGYVFVGWFKDVDDITTEYKSGSKYTEDVTYTAKYAHVNMLGAQVKAVVDNKSGIRFGTRIYNDGDEIVEKGTLILPANLLADGEALTLETPKAARSVGKVNYEVNEEKNYVTYLGTIINIPDSKFDTNMTASSYVIYKDKAGNNYTVYSPYKNGSTTINKLLGVSK